MKKNMKLNTCIVVLAITCMVVIAQVTSYVAITKLKKVNIGMILFLIPET